MTRTGTSWAISFWSRLRRRVKGCIRETDTVARFGGDEFVVMLNELSTDKALSIRQAEVIAEKIRSRLGGALPALGAPRGAGGNRASSIYAP
jgi:GGDEF domain-containing protein